MDQEINLDGFDASDQVKLPTVESIAGSFKESPIVYYCKECKNIVEPTQKGKKNVCPECKKSDLSMGTERSIKGHYRIAD